MKRVRLAVLFATVFGATLAFAPAVAAGTRGDRVSGFGVREPSCQGCEVAHFAFNVRSGKHGENPHGTVAIEFPAFGTMTGHATCLNVNGRWATVMGQIDTGSGGMDLALYGGAAVYFVFRVHGLGAPRNGKPGPDEMGHIEWNSDVAWKAQYGLELADICTDPTPVLTSTAMFKLVAGDIKVVDRGLPL